MTRAVVALGSNLGDRRALLGEAVRRMAPLGDLVAVSSLYETAPVGGPEQGPYLNAVAVIETDLAPRQLLDGLLAVEDGAGRRRRERWGPRTLDLDLVLYGRESVSEPGLEVPHPRLAERRFVLEPLAEVWPDARWPDGSPVAPLLSEVTGQSVERVDAGSWWEQDSPDDTDRARAGRGAWWVTGQAVLFGGLVVSLLLGSASWNLPGDWHRWMGRLLVLAGAVLVIGGLRNLGHNLTAFPEPTAGGHLVRHGVYGVVRHPIYGGNVLLMTGVALHQASLAGLLVALCGAVFFWLKAGFEEQRLLRRYPAYGVYRSEVRARLLPWVW